MREDTIEICHLKKAYGEHVIFSNLTMELKKGAVTCLMAPSGAGKTTLLRILAGLEQADGGKIGGLEALRKSMVFQEPRLAEELTAAANIQLAVRRRMFGKEKRSSRHLVEEMEELGLSGCENQAVSELSGGMRQRVVIAIAVACRPKILICDEPTTALDVTIQAQILDLMKSLQKELGMAIILITHDLGVVAQMCDEVIVMYAGSICEQGTADEIFYNPCHEYTKGLLRSIPSASNVGEKLEPIHGTPIDLLNMPAGCPFAPRCEAAMKICLRERAERMRINEDHLASCWMNVKKGLEDGSIELAEDKDAERKDGADA